MRKIKLLAFIILVFGALSPEKKISADENKSGFSITPFYQEVVVEGNQAGKSFQVEVENSTDVPAVFRLSVLDFGSLDESGGVAFLGTADPERRYGLASWIKLEKDAIVLNPYEKQAVKVTIENKESLSPGGHYAAILLKIEDKNDTSGQEEPKVTFNPSFSSLIFARKVGGEIRGLELKDWNLQKSGWFDFSGISLRFQNTGNTHLIPRGVASIFDPLGREVFRGAINTESRIIMPETFRSLVISLKKAETAIFPGKYTVLLQYRYDGKEEFVQKSREIFFLPPIFLGFLGLVGAISVGSYKIRKKRGREEKQSSKSKTSNEKKKHKHKQKKGGQGAKEKA